MKDLIRVDNLTTDNYASVILAAGYSSRMKSFKPLLAVGEMTAIERSVAAVKGAGIKNIVVVTGYNREKLKPIIDTASVNEAYNKEYDNGMFSSIKAGLSAVKELFSNTKGVVLMPVDCPLISSEVISEVIQSAAADDEFCVPVFKGKKGHPLMIPTSYTEEICGYDGSGGLKVITDKYWDKMKRIPVDEEGCILDMDTPEGYEEIAKFLAAGCRRVPLEKLASGRRIWLVRHGQTKQHDEKMFIGRYDVTLADDAEEDVQVMAMKLNNELERFRNDDGAGENVQRIYVSPLTRAVQTAEIIRDLLNRNDRAKNSLACQKIELCIEEDFQEISLGAWDGMPVRKVREEYPEEYALRGNDMFAFKIGNKAENFYDVQYRAVKALREILEDDDSRDIVVVTHSAVIRALENNLRGLDVADLWEPISKCEYRMMEL